MSGDDPATVELIEEHVPQGSFLTIKDDNGGQRIVSLTLTNPQTASVILPHLDKLARLDSLILTGPDVNDDVLKSLPRLPVLRKLVLAQSNISDAALEHLVGMNELRELRLGQTQVCGPGLVHLADSSKLEWLDLTSTPLDDSAMPHVVKNFPRLKRFEFLNTNVSPEGLLKLAELPWLTSIGPPNEIAASRDDPEYKQKTRDLIVKYVAAYKEFKRKAKEAGEEVPPDYVAPFGGGE